MQDERKERARSPGPTRRHAANRDVVTRLSSFVARAIAGFGRVRPETRLARRELSIVACDLRGFTPFSAAVAPETVVDLLREYYGAIGELVRAAGGTIKDHAGDGTLALVGATRPFPDHAERALSIAIAVGLLGDELRRKWRMAGIEIGIGIGVASGEVTFGSIEAGPRIESVAVGAAVNLAARLCARALAGQILVAERTVELVRSDARRRLERLETAELKGFASPVPIFEAVRV
jgi:class 3 adenylate cyclase